MSHMSLIPTDPTLSTLFSTLSTIWFPFGGTLFQSHCCCCGCPLTSPPLWQHTGLPSSLFNADVGLPSNQCVAIIPHASQGTCTVSGIELKGAQVQCVGGIWLRSTQQCTMNVNGCILGKWKCPGCICMSLIRMLNKTMASSALSQNGQLDRAGTARGSGPVGFGLAWQLKWMIKAHWLSGGRLSMHRGTGQGMLTSHKKGTAQGGSGEQIVILMVNIALVSVGAVKLGLKQWVHGKIVLRDKHTERGGNISWSIVVGRVL